MDGDIDFNSLLNKTPINTPHSLEPEVTYEETLISMDSILEFKRI